MKVQKNWGLRNGMIAILLISVLAVGACASSNKTTYQGYQPKYKKPNHNKPLPCPLKDC